MFTGIIETVGIVSEVRREQSNVHFFIKSSLSQELKVDQSVSHDGVCLTVTKVVEGAHWVTAIRETLEKSNVGLWTPGSVVNLERCMMNNGRFDGHIVQGHVDQVGIVKSISDQGGSWVYDFEFDPSNGNITVEKGSVCVNGVSLTCFNSRPYAFSVAVIPYTYQHTNFQYLRTGSSVNLEFDIIGKYVKRLMNLSS
jgi:riboflavin synthase